MRSSKFLPSERFLKSRGLLLFLKISNVSIGLAALALLIWSACYVSKPGPRSYYSHFSCLYFASCLAFQAIQLHLLLSGCTHAFKSRFRTFSAYIYWLIITLSGFICTVAYGVVSKSDCAIVQALVFLGGIGSFVGLQNGPIRSASLTVRSLPNEDTRNEDTRALRTKNPNTIASHSIEAGGDDPADAEETYELPLRRSRTKRCCIGFWKGFNRFLKFVHLAFAILFTCGAITLALQYQYKNPGKRIQIKLPTGETTSMNYNCTTVQSNGSSHPTIWFEGDAAHGVVDFLGVQIALAERHGRNSCSYDPPNFGWSDRMLSSYQDFNNYFDPLLDALSMGSENRILAGWGGGLTNALNHSIDRPELTKSLVILDASPDGIEWFDEARAQNWTSQYMQQYRGWDLSGRVFLAELILSLGIPWGLMPVLVPSDPSAYFDRTKYPRYHAQIMKEDFWATQYYGLLQEASKPIDTYLLDNTVGNGTATYALMTYNASTPETYSGTNEYYRTTKLRMANHIAGGNLTKSVAWCNDADCSLDFPVRKSIWTADTMISLGV